jgi:hypothetical protein
MGKEADNRSHQHEAQQPGALPPVLAEFLQGQQYACVTEATDRGTVLVVKAPAVDIERFGGRVPIEQRHELYSHPNAPVVRLVTTIHDQPGRPLKLETFINVADAQQRADLAALAEQEELLLLFYDEALRHRLSKRVRSPHGNVITEILASAQALRAAIPDHQFDFDLAKADVMRQVPL